MLVFKNSLNIYNYFSEEKTEKKEPEKKLVNCAIDCLLNYYYLFFCRFWQLKFILSFYLSGVCIKKKLLLFLYTLGVALFIILVSIEICIKN